MKKYISSNKVHVIGATGHIGSYLCPYLARNGYEVTGYSRGIVKPYCIDGFKENIVRMIKANRAQAIDVAIKSGADIICDLIPYTEDDARYICKQVLNSPRKRNIRLISVGSIWVYGEKVDHIVTEDDPRRATDNYGKQKILIEDYLLKQYAEKGLAVTIIHPGHICGKGWLPVGPQGNRNPNIIEEIKKGNRIILPDDGMATLQHVHALDIARIICYIIENESAVGESFNIVCDKPITLKEYAEMLYKHYGKKVNIDYINYKDFLSMLDYNDAAVSAEHIDRSPNVSMEKAKKMLGFKNIYTEKDLLLESIDYYFDNL